MPPVERKPSGCFKCGDPGKPPAVMEARPKQRTGKTDKSTYQEGQRRGVRILPLLVEPKDQEGLIKGGE
jgi:hypothetical protein